MTRTLSLDETPAPAPARTGRNVIAVVGIDAYAHWPTLHNAVGDASGMRTLFVDQLGFVEVVEPLVDGHATRDGVLSLVQDQLNTELRPDDSLVFFFAGHGHSESRTVGARTVETGYLIPTEGRHGRERKVSSWIRLDSLLEDIARLPARHVLVILDACYSGFALGEIVERHRSAERYTDDLDRRTSRRVISSALADQPALDSGPVPGHSLFTGALIDGLSTGAADGDGKGFVTGSELALHVQKRVAGWPGSRQTPDFGAFELDDRGELVIALRGETHHRLRAAECLAAADAIAELARLTGDAQRSRSAARTFRDALRHAALAKLVLPAATVGLGRALAAAGEVAEAERVLAELVERPTADTPAEAWLQLGLVRAGRREHAAAADALDAWRDAAPDHEDTGWITDYVGRLRAADRPSGRAHLLLVGIDRYASREFPPLRGCVNDVEQLMGPAFVRHCGPQVPSLVTLVDESATARAFVTELERLASDAGPDDAVVVHFSGHSIPDLLDRGHGDQYLIFHDTDGDGMTAAELHRLMQALPAAAKTLVLDTHPSAELIDLAERDGSYSLVLASDRAEIAFEWQVQVDGRDLPCGLLTGVLYRSMQAAEPGTLTYGSWLGPAVAMAGQACDEIGRPRQTPLFVGLKRLRVLGGDDDIAPTVEAMRGGRWSALTVAQLAREYDRFRLLRPSGIPGAHKAFGRAFLAKGAHRPAVEALRIAVAESPDGDGHLALCHALLAGGSSAEAKAVLENQVVVDGHAGDRRAALLGALDTAVRRPRRGLLIGIDRYRDPGIPPLAGAVNDVTALRRVLLDRWAFLPADIVVLTDEQATHEAILTSFKWVVEHSSTVPAILHFSGHGSHDVNLLPTLVPVDGRHAGKPDIALEELADIAGPAAAHLYSVLDTRFSAGYSPDDRGVAAPAGVARESAPRPDGSIWGIDRTRRVGGFSVLDSPTSR